MPNILFMGKVNGIVAQSIKVNVKVNAPIFIGETNITHIKDNHPEDYDKYFSFIRSIISSPDYLAYLPGKSSIEYIKIINGKHVLVAVRISNKSRYFVKTLFEMEETKVAKYKEANALIPYL